MSKKHAFISHAWGPNKEGHHWVLHLAERLEKEHQIRCWVDDQEQNLIAGDGLNRQLQLAIQDCPAFVAVLCNSYKASANCMAELSHANTHNRGPIPILREEVTKSNRPVAFNGHDEKVYLSMVIPPDFDLHLPKLAAAIFQRCQQEKAIRTAEAEQQRVAQHVKRRKYWSLIILGVIAMASVWVGLAWMHQEPQAHDTTRPTKRQDLVPPTTQRYDLITVPGDGKTAKIHSGGGQGGRVQMEGESKELKTGEVILLVVHAEDGIDYPQTNRPQGISPDENGNWTAEVQVGNDDSEPLKGLKFTVRMYVLSENDYLLLKKDNLETGGKAQWPPVWLPVRPTERAKTSFTLE